MATLTQIRTAVDNRLAVLWPKVRSRQAAYYATHGRYWQGLRFAAPSVDGLLCVPDKSLRPTDQRHSWADALPDDLDLSEPMALRVDVYAGPLGDGYTGTAAIKLLDGRVYERTANEGPETWRAHAWKEVADVPA